VRTIQATLVAIVLWATAWAAVGVEQPALYRGRPVALGNGEARSWVSLDRLGHPLAIGISLTEAALDNLPTTDTEVPLPLPAQARATVFRQAVLNWNPHGHIPPGGYDVPHFDFHFYTIPEQVRLAITATGPDLARAQKAPASRYLPQGYVPAPPPEPRMGLHWVNPDFPELHGQPFTASLIYGSYDGRLAFVEPMVTVAYLKTEPNLHRMLPQPEAYEYPGYFPRTWGVRWDGQAAAYVVQLGAMRPAAERRE